MTAPHNPAPILTNLLRAAEDPDIILRDQHPSDQPPPSLAPGWNAVSVTDLLQGMLLIAAAEQLPDFDDEEDHPDFTDEELDLSVPDLNNRIREAVTSNLISDELFLALRTEAQNIAKIIVRDMTHEERTTLLQRAKAKLTSD